MQIILSTLDLRLSKFAFFERLGTNYEIIEFMRMPGAACHGKYPETGMVRTL